MNSIATFITWAEKNMTKEHCSNFDYDLDHQLLGIHEDQWPADSIPKVGYDVQWETYVHRTANYFSELSFRAIDEIQQSIEYTQNELYRLLQEDDWTAIRKCNRRLYVKFNRLEELGGEI